MAKAAQELGYDVEVWAPALPDGVQESNWSFQVKRLPMTGDHSLRSQWRMAGELMAHYQRLSEATLYIPEPGPLLAMLLLQYIDTLQPERLLLTFHGSEIKRLASRRLLQWSTTHLLHKAVRVSVVSDFARELFLRHFPKSASKLVVTPGALRTDLATNFAARPARTRPTLVVLTVARINPRKGQLHVIEALKALPPEQRASIEYWLVGCHCKDNYDAALTAAAADIFAMTSMPHKHSVEGFGLVYLEAGAHGLPVVAHDIGGVAEAVAHGETGLLVAPGDRPALTAAFAHLIADADLRFRMGAAGQARVRRHSWRASAESLFGQPHAAPSA
jgi:glycosyltransferase involved in cell wall biosynthesis